MKKRGLWNRGVATGEPDQKPYRKKWPGLSDSGMASGGLKLCIPEIEVIYAGWITTCNWNNNTEFLYS